jgi:hypothetical protein
MTNLPRITFGMIVLNGEPFVRYNLHALYPFAHQIIVVEGAITVARSLATADGHSTDGTLKTLRKFKAENDPEDKVVLVIAEDEGKPDGFWSEKDEMSQAYAHRATGDWLWQVDTDEFYLEKDMETILEMLASDPDIATVSFPFRQFWGGFDYVETGLWFIHKFPRVHRLFRWRPGYQYVSHRPPTVVDEKGRDLRALKWISDKQMRRMGIYLYHYSYVLPKQARQKVGYYTHVTWSHHYRDNERWLQESYFGLEDPYFIGEGGRISPQWLERYRGPHPAQIVQMRQDLNDGRLKEPLRPTEDIEKLLSSPLYALGRWILRVCLFIFWNARRLSVKLTDLMVCKWNWLYLMVNYGVPWDIELGEWAMSFRDLGVIAEEIAKKRVESISMVELGGGASTLVFSKILDKLGDRNKLVSFEAEMSWFVHIRDLLTENEMGDKYRVDHVPYLVCDGVNWFDKSRITKTIEKDRVDVLVVDAPPDTLGPLSRQPAIPFFLPFLRSNSTVFLHDAKRLGERTVIHEWKQYFTNYEFINTRKGLAIFRNPTFDG